MPILKLPFHLSYILFLSRFSRQLAVSYFRLALALCHLTVTQPSILLHPLDFLGVDDFDDLSFFPGMDMQHESKVMIVKYIIGEIAKSFKIVTLGQHAKLISQKDHLIVRNSDIIEAKLIQ